MEPFAEVVKITVAALIIGFFFGGLGVIVRCIGNSGSNSSQRRFNSIGKYGADTDCECAEYDGGVQYGADPSGNQRGKADSL